jgi:hypothetical protein
MPLPLADSLQGRTGLVTKDVALDKEIVAADPNRICLLLYAEGPAANTFCDVTLQSGAKFRSLIPKLGYVQFTWKDHGPLVCARFVLPTDGTAGTVYYYECIYRPAGG